MANKIVYGIEINGNANGVINAVNQAVSSFSRLDAKLKSMANRAINATINQSAGQTADTLNSSKQVTQWQRTQELELFRQRVANAQAEYNAKKQAADQYYADILKNEKELAKLKRQRTTAAKTGADTKDLDSKIKAKESEVAKQRETYAKKYEAAVIASEKRVFSAVIAFAKKQAQVWKESLREQENDSKRSTDKKIQDAKRLEAEAKRVGQQMSHALNKAFNGATASTTSFFNSFRLLTQGVTELTRAMATYLALPIAGMFYAGFNAATDFETAMVRVDKTTNGMGGSIQQLNSWIRDFSQYTTSSQTELATFAEQLGQVGVDKIKPMQMLIRTVEMMATATDLSADEVTKAIGRIGTAFGYDLNTEEGAANMHKLANVINMLENTTASSAGEIVEGMLNVASTGGMLDIPIEQMAAIVASMESMGVAADAVGNRITRFFQQVIEKPDELAKMMSGFQSTISGNIYKTGDDIMKMMEKNPATLLADIVEMMGSVNAEVEGNKAESLQQWFDVFGQVGGKVGVLSGNFTSLAKAMNNATQEFMNGNSLFVEYDKALLTTQSHLKIMRNNINNAAITIGDAFLPVINRLIEYAVPVIQILTSAFKSLTFETKLLVVGLPLLVAVGAPLLFILSQLAHGAGMLFMGFQTAFLGVRSLMGALTGLGSIVFTAFKAFRVLATGGTAVAAVFSGTLAPTLLSIVGTIAVVVAAIVGIGYALRAVNRELFANGIDISGFFAGLAANMRVWGENLMVTFGNGLLAGAANYVVQALASIAEMIASFFEAHSPPEQGPLSTIDKWGGPLFTTFLRGFYLADFSILKDIGGTIKSILSNMISGDEAEGQINRMVAGAREALAELINVFNRTGEISQGLLDRIVAGTGHLGEEVKKLITLSLEYERSQRRLAELEKQKEQANKSYEQDVARIADANMTAEQKAEQIRNSLSGRNKTLRAIEKEKKAEEEKSAALKEQLDWQKEFINAQIDQADLFSKIAKQMEKAADALSGLGNLKFGGAPKTGKGDGALEEFKTTIQKNIESANAAVLAVIRGVRGEGIDDLLYEQSGKGGYAKGEDTDLVEPRFKRSKYSPEQEAEIRSMYGMGQKVHGLIPFGGKIQPMGGGQGGDAPQMTPPDPSLWDQVTGFFGQFSSYMDMFDTAQDSWAEAGKALQDLWKTLQDVFGVVVDISDPNRPVWEWADIGKATVNALSHVLVFFASIVATIGNFVASTFSWLVKILSNAFESVVQIGANFVGVFTSLYDVIIGVYEGLTKGDWSKALSGLRGLVENLGGLVGNLIAGVLNIASGLVLGVLDILLGLAGDILTILVTLFAGEEAGRAVHDWFAGIRENIKTAWEDIKKFFKKIGKDFSQWVSDIFSPKKSSGGKGRGLNSMMPDLDFKTWLTMQKDKFVEGFNTFISELGPNISTSLSGLFSTAITSISEKANQWGQDIIKFLGDGVLAGGPAWLTTAITEAGNLISSFLDPSILSQGPLVTLATWGDNLIKLFADGILSGVPTWIATNITEVGKKIAEYLDVLSGSTSGPLADVFEWGENLLKVFGDGLLSGVNAIGDILAQVGQRIADFLQPHSPPKEGPLSTIDTWGSKLLDLFLAGFTSGDFNPIQVVAGKVSEALSNLFGGGGEGASGTDLASTFVGMLDSIIAVFTEKIPLLEEQWAIIRDMPLTVFGEEYGATVLLPIFTMMWEFLTIWFTTYTPLMLMYWTLFRDTFSTAFTGLYPKVATVFSSLMFQPEVVAAMTAAQGQFYNKGAEFAQAVGLGINGMAGAVIGEMMALVDGLIAQIDRAIAAVESLIDALENLREAGGRGVGVNVNTGTPATPFASGGIVTRPTVGLIGEAGEDEAVIPLSRLPGLLGASMPVAETTQINININGGDFRDEDNVKDVVRDVRKALTSSIMDQKRMRGKG